MLVIDTGRLVKRWLLQYIYPIWNYSQIDVSVSNGDGLEWCVEVRIATLLLRENTNKYKGHLVVCVSIRISGFN